MFYSYVRNNTQAKNAKERQIDSTLQTLHLVVFQNIDDVENFMGFVNKLISEKNANYQKTKPLKLELVVYEKIKGNFFFVLHKTGWFLFLHNSDSKTSQALGPTQT